jgi:hypothetical protein
MDKQSTVLSFASVFDQRRPVRMFLRNSDQGLSTSADHKTRRNTDDSISSRISKLHVVSRVRSNNSNEMEQLTRSTGLRKVIKDQMVLHEKHDLRFLPEKTLKQLLGKQEIMETLRKLKPPPQTDIPTLASFVCDKVIKLFAILAWSEVEYLIEQFYLHGFGDEHLPIGYNSNGHGAETVFSQQSGNGSPVDDHPFKYHYWTERHLELFCDEDQWHFLSPVFSENQFRYTFPNSIRMPFVDLCARSQKESFFSVVQERRIHRDHLQTSNYIVRYPLSSQVLFIQSKLMHYDMLIMADHISADPKRPQ